MRTKVFLAVLALLHVALAISYASVTPYRTAGYVNGTPKNDYRGTRIEDYGAPDERQHANYVQKLLNGKGIPVFDAKDPNLYENYQSHQPPLFYFLEAGWCSLVGIDDLAKPNGSIARYFNAFVGGGTVVGVFYLCLWGLGRKDVGLVAAALCATLPMMCALSGAISNDPLLYCLCTWALAFMVKQVRDGWSVREAAILGALIGLAMLTKTTGVSLLPALLLAIWFQSRKGDARLPLLSFGLAWLVVVPWWIRNQNLYGDPLAMKVFREAFTGNPKTADMIAAMGAKEFWVKMFGWWSMRSFFGVFGYMDIFLNNTGLNYMGPKDPNILYLVLFLIFFFSGLLGAKTFSKPESKPDHPIHAILALFTAVVVLLYLSFNLTYFQAQARYIYPAIGPICLLVALGMVETAKRWKYLCFVPLVLGIGFNAYVLKRLPAEFVKRGTDQIAKDILRTEEAKSSVQN